MFISYTNMDRISFTSRAFVLYRYILRKVVACGCSSLLNENDTGTLCYKSCLLVLSSLLCLIYHWLLTSLKYTCCNQPNLINLNTINPL